MPVDTKHPEYVDMAPKWRTVRDVVAGDFAVKAAGIRYLPKNPNQTQEEYEAYTMRGTFFGATGRTVTALRGLIFRKPVVIEAPDALNSILEDITMTGESVEDMCKRMTDELLTPNRCGVLVDFSAAPEGAAPSNAAQAQAMGLRPYASMYTAESIINWRFGRVNGVTQPVLIVLDESGLSKVSDTDMFVLEGVERIRVLRLDDAGLYVQEVYEKTGSGWSIVSVIEPMANGKRFNFIPFVPTTAGKLSLECNAPTILALALENLSHYRTKTQLKHGAHYTALPTSYVTGYDKPTSMENGVVVEESFPIGSSAMLTFPRADTRIGYHEFKGDGLGSLERGLDREEREMAILGAHLMTGEKAGVEASGTVEMRTAGETSVLGEIAMTVSRAMTKVCQIIADWQGVSGKVLVTVNKDFAPVTMSPQLVAQLFAMLQGGAISPQTFFWNLQAGELVPDGKTFEEEQAQIDTSAPSITAPGPADAQ